jgi:Ca-activated chloride channel homolog
MTRRTTLFMLASMLAGLLAVASQPSFAGRLYARKLDTASPLYNLRMTSVRSTVIVRNLLAVTHVDEEFINDEPIELEGFYVFQLPEGAVVDGLWLWENGKRYRFAVKRKEEAQHIYDSLAQNHIGAPAILQSYGANRFELRIFPIRPGERRRVELQYFQLLPMNPFGQTRYYYPLNLDGYQDLPVDSLHVRVWLDCDYRMDSLRTNFDGQPQILTFTPVDSAHAVLTLRAADFTSRADLVITFQPTGWNTAFPALSYAEKDTVDDGFFIVWTPIPPPDDLTVKADFTFAIDVSASMTGLRIEAVRNSLQEVLRRLQPYDRFRLVLFSDQVISCPADTSMLFADSLSRRIAGDFLDAWFRPRGGTDYAAALSSAAGTSMRAEAEQRVVFITDGLPNRGARRADSLVAIIRSAARPIRFFPVTLFTENVGVLYDVSRQTGGKLTAIEQGDSIPTVIDRLAFDFTQNSYDSPALFLPPSAYLPYPMLFPAAATSEELVCAGRFFGSGPVPFRLTYLVNTQPAAILRNVVLQPDTAELVEVARYWASQRIQQLLRDLKGVTDSTQIREEVIRLSERFNILSPFTAFIVITEPDPLHGVGDVVSAAPATVELLPGYPNPFRSETTIAFRVPPGAMRDGGRVTVSIYDERGALVRVLTDGCYTPGVHELRWDGTDAAGVRLPTGRYFCVLRAGGTLRMISLIVIR